MIFARCGKSETGMGSIIGQISDTHTIMIGGRLVPKNDRDRSNLNISQAIKEKIQQIPGIKTIDFAQQDMMAMMSGGDKPVSIEIYGNFVQIFSHRYLQGILIENVDVSKTLGMVFEMVWKVVDEGYRIKIHGDKEV